MQLTHSKLLELVNYDPETGVFTNKVQRVKSLAGKVLGFVHPQGYLQARILYKNYLLHRLAWFYVYGEWPSKSIDHINGDKKDNRICNLRDIKQSENMQNIPNALSRSKSKVRGVSWDATRNKWTAHICVDGKQKNLGRFYDLDEAAHVYAQARQVFHPYAPKGV